MAARHMHVAVRKKNVKARAIQHTTEQELEAPWINSVNMEVPSRRSSTSLDKMQHCPLPTLRLGRVP
jgi:hypothetical protein